MQRLDFIPCGLVAVAFAAMACGGDVAPVVPDAQIVDSGPSVGDAGTPDTGRPDAQIPDSGEPDAGSPDAGAPRDAGPPLPPPPDTLAKTGLYADPATETLAADVRAYTPRFELWSDAATKRRYIALPAGTTIDTSNPDRWTFPVGTKLWKEFSRDGVRVETRMLEKAAPPNRWTMIAYAWNAAQTEARASPDGAMDHLGTNHDVPTARDCLSCHLGLEDRVLGFGGLQLAGADGDTTVASLVAEGLLSDMPPAFDVPGDALDRDVLSYLHANCGGCHNASTVDARPDFPKIEFWLTADRLTNVVDTPTYTTTVDVRITAAPLPGVDANRVIAPGDPMGSMLLVRMMRRGFGFDGMPPWFASEDVHMAATASVSAFIERL